jgi:hypothetical protein
MNTRSLTLAALVFAGTVSVAQATPIVGSFNGTITNGPGLESGVNFSNGQTVTGRFTYDSNQLSADWVDAGFDSHFSANNPATPLVVTLTIGGHSFTETLANQLWTYADTVGDWDVGALGTSFGQFGISATGTSIQYLSDLANPGSVGFSVTFPSLSNNGQAWIDFQDNQQALITVTSLDVFPVPEPTTLALLATLMGGLAVGRRKSRR